MTFGGGGGGGVEGDEGKELLQVVFSVRKLKTFKKILLSSSSSLSLLPDHYS